MKGMVNVTMQPDLDMDEVIQKLNLKVYRNCLLYNGGIPYAVGSQAGHYTLSGKEQWTDGFWPGLLLLAYSGQRDDLLLHEYEGYVPFLTERIENDPVRNKEYGYLELDHDVGFIFHLTAVYHYMLTGNQSSKAVGLMAAAVLLDRFQSNENSSYIAPGMIGKPIHPNSAKRRRERQLLTA